MPGEQELDEEFDDFQKKHPGARFADYYVHQLSSLVKSGVAHSTLGPNLIVTKTASPVEFLESGRAEVADQIRLFSIEPHHKVIDYGCGSLRLGVHYIRHLDPGGYFGLDVADTFFNIGKQLIGDDLFREKRPRLAVISPESIAEATAFGADFVFANLVAYHVHPAEQEAFLHNLISLASKDGAHLFFDAKLSHQARRTGRRSWVWPLSHYVTHLAPLRLDLDQQSLDRIDAALRRKDIVPCLLRFRRGTS